MCLERAGLNVRQKALVGNPTSGTARPRGARLAGGAPSCGEPRRLGSGREWGAQGALQGRRRRPAAQASGDPGTARLRIIENDAAGHLTVNKVLSSPDTIGSLSYC